MILSLVQVRAQTSPATDDFLYARKLFAEGYYELCLAQLEAFAQRHPEAEELAEGWRLMGEANMALKRHADAETAFRTCELRYPHYPAIAEVRLLLAESQRAQGRLTVAAASFERVVALHPRSEKAPFALYQAGALWQQSGDAQRAREVLYRLMESQPTSQYRLPAHLLLVQSLAAGGDPARALQEADNLFRAIPSVQLTGQAYFVRGRLQEQLGQPQMAEESYQEVLKRFPKTAWAGQAQARVAELQFSRGEVAAALASLERALGDTPEGVEKNRLILRGAEMRLRAGRLQEAAAALSKFEGAQADSVTSLVYFHTLGLVQERNGDPAAAVTAYHRALEYTPATELASDSTSPAPQFRRQRSLWRGAQLNHELGRHAEALQGCRRYRREYPTGPFRDALLLLEARVQQSGLGNLGQALRLYDELIGDYPRSQYVDDAHFALAEIYEQTGELHIAARQWERFCQLYPASEHEPEARRRLRLLRLTNASESPATLAQLSETLLRLQQGSDREQLLLSLARLHFERGEYPIARRHARQALAGATVPALAREAAFLLGASYDQEAEVAGLRGQPARALQDSAQHVLREVIAAGPQDALAEQAGVRLARMMFNENTPRTAGMLARADSLLMSFGDGPAADELRLWAAITRRSMLARQDTVAGNRVALALQKLSAVDSAAYRNAALYELAMLYLQRGDSSAALRQFALLQASPRADRHQVRGQFQLAKWLAERKDYKRALEILRELGERYFYSAYADSARELRLRWYIASGQPFEALQLLGDPLEDAGSDSVELVRARLLESTGEKAQAIQAYLRFLARHGNMPEAGGALVAAARLTESAGARQLAAGYYEECIRRFPATEYSQEARFRLAELHYDQGDFTTARRLYREAADERPDAPPAQDAMKKAILCLYKTNAPGQAEAEIKAYEGRYKSDRDGLAEFQHAAGELAVQNKDFANAERIFKKLAKDYRDTPSGILGDYGLGKTYLIQNKTEDALETLTGIPKRYPGHPFLQTVYLGLGDFYQAQQQWDNAIAAFTKVVQDSAFDDNYRLALRSLLDVYDRLGLKDRALALARHYVSRFPDDKKTFDLRIKIALLLIDLLQYDDAIAQLRQLKPFADATTEPELQYYIGKSHMNAGRFELAIAELLRVKFFSKPTKLPWDVIALYDAATCYARLNNCVMARKLYQQIVREQGAASEFGRFASNKIAEMGPCPEAN